MTLAIETFVGWTAKELTEKVNGPIKSLPLAQYFREYWKEQPDGIIRAVGKSKNPPLYFASKNGSFDVDDPFWQWLGNKSDKALLFALFATNKTPSEFLKGEKAEPISGNQPSVIKMDAADILTTSLTGNPIGDLGDGMHITQDMINYKKRKEEATEEEEMLQAVKKFGYLIDPENHAEPKDKTEPTDRELNLLRKYAYEVNKEKKAKEVPIYSKKDPEQGAKVFAELCKRSTDIAKQLREEPDIPTLDEVRDYVENMPEHPSGLRDVLLVLAGVAANWDRIGIDANLMKVVREKFINLFDREEWE